MESSTTYDATLDESMEDRSRVEFIRGEEKNVKVGNDLLGKIESYKFKILVRDKPTFEGKISRDEMNLIHNLYTTEGANLSQREVSRYFTFTLEEFKRILRAFNITKASVPLAPHMIEEKSPEELIKLTLHNKENHYLKKLEHDRNRLTETRLKEITKKFYDLQNNITDFSEFITNVEFKVSPIQHIKPKVITNKTLVVYISDMHIGAEVSGYSIYKNNFDFEVSKERLLTIIRELITVSSNFKISNLIVCNIGDSLDGYNGQTTRGGHILPQNMNNKDQFKNYIQLMLDFFAGLSTSGYFNTIQYYCVEGGNHDGDVGFMVNKSLEACLAILNPNIEVTVFERFIDHFTCGNHTFVLCHGKDAKDMFKNMPLVLNDKTENQINEYLDYNAIYDGPVHFIKGDLHQTATTYGKRFRYKSVSSFFGSSEWIHKNFGNTKASVDYDIVIEDNIFEGKLILN